MNTFPERTSRAAAAFHLGMELEARPLSWIPSTRRPSGPTAKGNRMSPPPDPTPQPAPPPGPLDPPKDLAEALAILDGVDNYGHQAREYLAGRQERFRAEPQRGCLALGTRGMLAMNFVQAERGRIEIEAARNAPPPPAPEPIAQKWIPNPDNPGLTFESLQERGLPVVLEFQKRNPDVYERLSRDFHRRIARPKDAGSLPA